MSERYLISSAENCLYVDDLSGKHRWATTDNVFAVVARRLMCEAFTDGWNAHRECWTRERSELQATLQSISDERDRLAALTEDLRAAQPVETAKPESEKEGEL